jgi:hypothetical protein
LNIPKREVAGFVALFEAVESISIPPWILSAALVMMERMFFHSAMSEGIAKGVG